MITTLRSNFTEEILGSNLDQIIGYPDTLFVLFPPAEFQGSAVKQTTTASFQTLIYAPLVIIFPPIRRFISALETKSLNFPRISQ